MPGVTVREAPSIRVDRIGTELQPVVVIEGFAPDPERLVEEAATLKFEVMGDYYPGIRAPVTRGYFDGLAPILKRVMSEVFGARSRLDVTRALYSLAITPPSELALAQRIPHIDSTEARRIAILHYLSHGEHEGTAFYRHRSTGYETVDAARHRAYLDALQAHFAQHGEPMPAYIRGNTEIFEQIACYEAHFNRALIYRSSLLHCAMLPNDVVLPADPRTGRLTVASFLTVH